MAPKRGSGAWLSIPQQLKASQHSKGGAGDPGSFGGERRPITWKWPCSGLLVSVGHCLHVDAWPPVWVSTLPQGCFLGWVAALPHQAPAYWNGSPEEVVPEAQVGGSFLSPLTPCSPHWHPSPRPTVRERGWLTARETCLPLGPAAAHGPLQMSIHWEKLSIRLSLALPKAIFPGQTWTR